MELLIVFKGLFDYLSLTMFLLFPLVGVVSNILVRLVERFRDVLERHDVERDVLRNRS